MKLEVVILAAGKGTRMKSALPKVLHCVAGKPLLHHVITTAHRLNPKAIHVVVGHGAQQVQDSICDEKLNWVLQEQQLGTGHAVAQALPDIDDDSVVLVLYGDVPLTPAAVLQNLVEQSSIAPALLTAIVADPTGLGRILRNSDNALTGVVEEKDASDEQRSICEVNTGVMAGPARDFKHYLPKVGNDNKQGEYYLPDVLSLAVADGKTIASAQVHSELEVQGINDRVQLNLVEREYQRLQALELMRQGVDIRDGNRLDIRGELSCGEDVSLDVNVVIEGKVSLGDGVVIEPNCVLRNVSIGAGSVIKAFSHLENAKLGAHCDIGPYARLRPGTTLADGVKVGNFVETKNSQFGKGSKANHLAYIGDAQIGAACNIGAGTITCNYDGVNKHRTVLGDGVFIGSNSTLVAPLEVKERGFVGAGSTITRTVESENLAVGRSKQRNIEGWKRPEKQQG